MKAMIVERLGGPEVLRLGEQRDPEPGPFDLLVEVHASSMNPVDTKVRRTGLGGARECPLIVGFDVSGVVRATGGRVKGFETGDEIWASPSIGRDGAHAELVLVDYRTAARKPQGVDHVQAAALPLVTLTAWEALVERTKLRRRQTVLVQAGGGGVGHVAIQLARNAGCRVLATASRPESSELCRELGADVVINYREENVVERVHEETGGKGCNVAFDTVGGEVFAETQQCVAMDGHMAAIVPEAESPVDTISFRRNVTLHLEFMGMRAMFGVRPQRHGRILERAARLVEQGQLRAHVSRVVGLDDLPEAHRTLESGHTTGKIAVQVR
jgi:NADPH2:quinone reductase